MSDETDYSANVEWKQESSTDKNSRVSRRLDMQKVAAANNKKKNNLDVGVNRIKTTAPNLKKMRAKIKEVFDEDDEDEEEGNSPFPNFNTENTNESNSLFNSLKEDEKQKIMVDQILKDQTMQQNAGKMEAIISASQQSKKLGLKKIDRKIANDGMVNIATDAKTFAAAVKQQIEKKEKVKISEASTYSEVKDLVNGLKKVKKIQLEDKSILDAQKAEKLKADDLIELGREKNDEKAAKIIINKTGRPDKRALLAEQKEKNKSQEKAKNSLRKNEKPKDYER